MQMDIIELSFTLPGQKRKCRVIVGKSQDGTLYIDALKLLGKLAAWCGLADGVVRLCGGAFLVPLDWAEREINTFKPHAAGVRHVITEQFRLNEQEETKS